VTTIELLDPSDDARFAEFHAAYYASHDSEWDRPYSAGELRAEILDPGGYELSVHLLARDGKGAIVGVGSAYLPLKDNLTLAYVSVHVVPEHRRHGHGSAILEGLAEIARKHGRATLMAEVKWDGDQSDSANVAFAAAHGFALDLLDAHRVLFLPVSLPPAPVRDGYTLQTWRGPCPQEWIDQYANLLTLIVQEAPMGEFPLENEFYDAERVRSDEALFLKQRRQMQVVVALSPAGDLAGHTQLVFPESDPRDAYQWDTLVLKEHRGHGLGLSLKVRAMEASQDLLEGRAFIHTHNAARNVPMITVNEAMGFRQVGWLGEYVRKL